MAEIRSLKLALLADTKQFIEGLDKADKETRSFSSKLGDALKKGALAFAAVGAAAGAMAIKIGVDAVKGAIEDAKAQATLAQTLRNTTKATDTQIKSVEDYITKTERASAVNAELLRPSLDRLVRSTGDVTKAQKLQQLALDIAAGTGKDLATITEGLGKAYDGNLGALKRLGVPLDESIVKSKDFDAAVVALTKTFEGQADIAANTFAGRMTKISLAFDEAKDALGFALLPLLEKFADFIQQDILPAVQGLVDGLTGKKRAVVPAFLTFNETLETSEDAGYNLGEALRNLAKGLGTAGDDFENQTDAGSGLVKFINLLTDLVNLIDNLSEKINTILGPFSKLLDFSQRFAETESQRRIDFTPTTASLPTVGGARAKPTVTITNNFKGPVDQQATARAMVKVVNTALSTTGISFINPAFR
jgi:hypothetical protein